MSSDTFDNSDTMVGYPATLTNQKRYQKRRSFYDKSHLDMAVDLVIKNKLSMRAASHIYKIPFSTLRTRKVFLTCGMTAAEYDKINKIKNRLGGVGVGGGGGGGGTKIRASAAPTLVQLANSNNNNNNLGGGMNMDDDMDENYDDLIDESYDDNEYSGSGGGGGGGGGGGNGGGGDEDDDFDDNNDLIVAETDQPAGNSSSSSTNGGSFANNSHQPTYPTFSVVSLNGGQAQNSFQAKKPPNLNLPNQQMNKITTTANLSKNIQAINSTTLNQHLLQQQQQQKRLYIKQTPYRTNMTTNNINALRSTTTTTTTTAASSSASAPTSNKINAILQSVKALNGVANQSSGTNSIKSLTTTTTASSAHMNAMRAIPVNGNNNAAAGSRLSLGGNSNSNCTNVNHFRTTSVSSLAANGGGGGGGGGGMATMNKPPQLPSSSSKSLQQSNQLKLSSILPIPSLKNKNANIPSLSVANSATAAGGSRQSQQYSANYQKLTQIKMDLSDKHSTQSQISNSEYLTRTITTSAATVPNEPASSDKCLYKCKQCDLLFLNSYFLQQHINSPPLPSSSAHNHHTPNMQQQQPKKESDRTVYLDSLEAMHKEHFTCSFCSLTTLDKISFLAHVPMCCSMASS